MVSPVVSWNVGSSGMTQKSPKLQNKKENKHEQQSKFNVADKNFMIIENSARCAVAKC